MKELADFIKGALSNDQPQSFARLTCAFIVYFLVMGFCFIWSRTGVLPDIPAGWVTLIALLYGSSKAGDVITAVKGAASAGPVQE